MRMGWDESSETGSRSQGVEIALNLFLHAGRQSKWTALWNARHRRSGRCGKDRENGQQH